MKYFLYARKSSESEDRQIQSIDDQIKRLEELAKNLKLEIVYTYTESKSAKKPDNRPLFDEMMDRIEKGEADGILCWQINRLSRNPIDSGKISWLLQKGVLKSIQTIDREYLPDDNVLLFSIESGTANQFIIDLSKNTKRGLQGKLEKGWLPSSPPQGYLNDKIEKTIIEDPERFNLIRKMWDLMLTGTYTPPKILDIANNEWGFKTKKLKRTGDKPLSRASIYNIFTNIFYTGLMEYNGKQYQGKHKPMITLEEFDRVQMLLGRKGRPRPQKHEFAFTGMIRCDDCGAFFTAEKKKKLLRGTGEIKEYIYYHCTHRKKDIKCSQRKVMREEELELQIEKELEKYTILPEFKDWALEVLNENNDKEIEKRTNIHEIQSKEIINTQKELDNLTKMRYKELIDDDMFLRQKDDLQARIKKLQVRLRETENRAEKWIELTEKTFNFATYAHQNFITGDLQTKKEILNTLGSNFLVKDGKLSISINKWFETINNKYPALEKKYLRLEPSKMPLNKRKTEALTSVRLAWLPMLDAFRTINWVVVKEELRDLAIKVPNLIVNS